MPRVYLEVDATDLNLKISRLQQIMKPQQFERAMYGVFNRTGRHVKTILRKDIPLKYNVSGAQVAATVKRPNVGTALGGGPACTIPIVGARRHIGGKGRTGFPASGGLPGYASLTSGHYDITAQIYRGQSSTLPARMSGYGGFPPFRNTAASGLHGIVYTRKKGVTGFFKPHNVPIEKVMGIAIPQMPLNKAEPEVQKDIRDYLEKRVEARIQALIANGR